MFGKAAIVWHARTVPERRGAILLCCTARHGLGGEARRREEQKTWQPRLIACQCITASGASRFQGLFFFFFSFLFFSPDVPVFGGLDTNYFRFTFEQSLDIRAVSPPRTSWGEYLLPFPISHSSPPPPPLKRQGRRRKRS